ncbi:hypothetical protein QVD17_26889 [Tagetes erecta]|uniref:Uncharacterized protein n=1 Tax=Tagetes erecta TaxID=13708 RepID=A0AAD8K7D8_TARER|nr:hypothetical protein QVD17_26889 [Tagetes erecta]
MSWCTFMTANVVPSKSKNIKKNVNLHKISFHPHTSNFLCYQAYPNPRSASSKVNKQTISLLPIHTLSSL